MTIKELKELEQSIIGQHVECIFTGMIVTGIVTDIYEDDYIMGVKVKYDTPHEWGGELYETGFSTSRKFDDFGSLEFVKLI